jgi:hypothetical protein
MTAWRIVFPYTTPQPDVIATYAPALAQRLTDGEARALADFLRRVSEIVAANNARRSEGNKA